MRTPILKFFKPYCKDCDCTYINSLLVSSFLIINRLTLTNNKLLFGYLLPGDNEDLAAIISKIQLYNHSFTLEDLMEVFEFVVSPQDKEVNGAVYTPRYIRKNIIKTVLSTYTQSEYSTLKYADIACGCGAFLLDIAIELHSQGCSFSHIYRNNIFGLDIQGYSIERTKIVLSLLALTYGEDEPQYDFNLYQGNALSFDWTTIEAFKGNNGFDIIVGNPPYVSSSKIDEESKVLMHNWSVSRSGKADLYIPFFQIALENIREGGVLGYITVNNFQRSINGRCLRHYFLEKQYKIRIIDFCAERVFPGRSVYTCIFYAWKKRSPLIMYSTAKPKEINNDLPINEFEIQYSSLDSKRPWVLKQTEISRLLTKIEKIGTPLGNLVNIKNGLATLKNDIFIFTVKREDNNYFYLYKESKEYRIEKGICREIIKGNILRSEDDLIRYSQKIIFPYVDSSNGKVLISEQLFRETYPNAFKYLEAHRSELAKRDKGARTYEAWYAFGRTQALNVRGKKLFCPYIADKPYFILSTNENLLFYNGYALLSDNIDLLKFLQKILGSSIFWFYIKNQSKPYGGDFYSLAKNYIQSFGIPNMTDEQKNAIINMNIGEVDNYLYHLYEIDPESISLF